MPPICTPPTNPSHLFALQHCIYYDCLMKGAAHLTEFDKTPIHLCPVCLRKLQISAKFDVIKRGRRLLSLYQDFGWAEDAAWTENWIAAVGGSGNGEAGKKNSTAGSG